MVDYPGKSLAVEVTEQKIDTVVAEFECDPGDIVKREFPNVAVQDMYDIAAVLQV